MKDNNNRIHFKRGSQQSITDSWKKRDIYDFFPQKLSAIILKNRGRSWFCDHHLYQMDFVTQTFSYNL